MEPNQTAGSHSSSWIADESDILNAFHGTLHRHRIPVAYHLGILGAAVLMVILPLVYLTIPITVGWLAWIHLTTNHVMLQGVRGFWPMVFVGGTYILPGLIAIVLAFFMLRPFFMSRDKAGARFEVDRADQPQLVAFVERVRELVGAPGVRRIVLDAEVNASASLGSGWTSIFHRRLVLTIGMPLISGLTVQQLGGVLAHEFGHFSQGVGMRLTHLVRTINLWFVHAVYYRDGFDAGLEEMAAKTDLRFGWLIWACRGAVGLTRLILKLFMKIGELATTYLMRRMEFDADTRQIELAGSRAFGETMERLRTLALGQMVANQQLSMLYRDGFLVDDLGHLVTESISLITEKQEREFQARRDERAGGMYDTHPPDHDRIAAATRAAAEGILRANAPATVLLREPERVAREFALDFYQNHIGLEVQRDALRPTAQVLAIARQAQAAARAGERGFRAAIHPRVPCVDQSTALDPDPAVGTTPEIRAALEGARKELVSRDDELTEVLRAVDDVVARIMQQEHLVMQHDLGVPLDPRGGAGKSRSELDASRKAELNNLRRLQKRWRKMLAPAFLRIAIARGALGRSDLEFDEESRRRMGRDCDRLVPTLEALASGAAETHEAGQQVLFRDLCFGLVHAGVKPESILQGATVRASEINARLVGLRSSFSGVPYPYEHSRRGIDVAGVALPEADEPQNALHALQLVATAYDTLRLLEQRILFDLTKIAEEVESALGLAEMSEPPKRTSADADVSADSPDAVQQAEA